MNKFTDHLDTLKQMLMTENDFGTTFTYFFTHLGENSDFLDYGKRTKKPVLKGVLEALGQQLFGDDGTITHLIIVKTRKYRFYHGSCFLHTRLANFFFFEEIDMGMVAVDMAPKMHFARFTSTPIEGGKNVVLPPAGKRTIH